MGTIKDRNGKDLIEVKEINRWQDTQNYLKKKKKILMTRITMMVWSLT